MNDPNKPDVNETDGNKSTLTEPNSVLNNEHEESSPKSARKAYKVYQDSKEDSNEEEEEEYEPASCMQQTITLVRKNLLNKKRTPVGTILELASPSIFMLILVLGYSLSEESYRDVGKYDEWDFDLPNDVLTGAVIDAISGGIGNNTLDLLPSRRNLLERKLSKLNHLFDYDEADELEELDDTRVGNSKSHLFQWKTVHQISRMLQSNNDTQGEDEQDDGIDNESFEEYRDVAQSLNGIRNEVRKNVHQTCFKVKIHQQQKFSH